MTLIEDAEYITEQIVADASDSLNAVLDALIGDSAGYMEEKYTPRQQVIMFAETLAAPWGMAKYADNVYRRLQQTASMLPSDTRMREGFDDRGLRMLAALIAAQYAGKMRKLAVAQGMKLPLLPVVLPPEPPPPAATEVPNGGPNYPV